MWVALAGLVLLASGCATAPVSAPQAAFEAEGAHTIVHGKGTDEIARLLARMESSDLRVGRSSKPAPTGLDQRDTARSDFVSQAMAHLGTRYRYGGDSPEDGFDCSGLIWFTARESLGLQLPRNAAAQAKEGVQVARADLKRGDLVFFNTQGRRYSHVGIYLGNDRFLHAPSSGGKVRVDQMSASYWKARYNGARRLAALSGAGQPLAQAPASTVKAATRVAANNRATTSRQRTARR